MSIQKSDFINVGFVLGVLNIQVPFVVMKEVILERSLINALAVAKSFQLTKVIRTTSGRMGAAGKLSKSRRTKVMKSM